MIASRSCFVGLWILALALPAAAVPQQYLDETAKLVASDGQPGDHFGDVLALDAGTLVVGAPDDDDVATNSGAAYVFELGGSGWSEVQKLVAIDGASNDRFGERVAIDGDTLVLSASNDDVHGERSGSVYVFARSAGVWAQEAKLAPDDGVAQDHFGRGLAISGARIVVGAPGIDAGAPAAGAAYVFVRDAGGWHLEQKLQADVPLLEQRFGTSVAIAGPVLAVGAPDGDGETYLGRVYCFGLGPSGWVQEQVLLQPSGTGSNAFGHSLSMTLDRLGVGRPYGGNGAVYAYRRTGDAWAELDSTSSGEASCCARYGQAFEIDGDTIAGGGWNVWPGGRSYVHHRYGGWWTRAAVLRASDAEYEDDLGISIALEGTLVLSGARGDDDLGSDAGAVYVHDIASLDISTPFCFGDGSGTPCPCGNETLPGNGDGCANASGDGGALFATGTASMSADDLTLWAYSDACQSGLLFRGNQSTGGGIPFGDGLLCVGGGFVRLGARTGFLLKWKPEDDIEIPGGWAPGDTVLFQAWYRVDPAEDVCGAPLYNLTNALAIEFRP